MNERRWAGLLLCLASFALYLRTLAPTVVELFDDSLEFQLAGFRLAIAHPTGYPLYMLLLKGFSLLPFGEVAGRANLASAVCAALAVGLVYAVVLQLSGSTLPALGAGATLALSSVFWSQAVVAEVYALNAVFVAAITLWVAADSAAIDSARPRTTVLAFLFGLALTHHRTIILLVPAVAVYLVLRGWGRWRLLLGSLVNRRTLTAFIAPLLLYLYLPWRGSTGSLDGTYQNTLDGFWHWITASYYNIFLTGNPFNEHYDAAFFFDLFQKQFGWLGLALCVAGVAALIVRNRRGFFAYWLSAFFSIVLFVVNYRVPDVQVFAIPAFLLMAIALGLGLHAAGHGLAALAARVGIGGPGIWAVFAGLTLALLLALNALPLLASAWAENDLSSHTEVRDRGRDWLAQPLPPDSHLVGILGEMTLVRYLQAAEGRHPALVTIAADRDAERMAAIDGAMLARYPVYTTRPLKGLPEKYALGALGGLVRIWPAPPPPELGSNAPQIAGIRYRAGEVSQPYPSLVRAQIVWQPDAPVPVDLKVSARLLDGERLVAQHDDWPVYNTYHTTFWRAGESIHDAYEIAIPRPTPPGTYQLLLIVYRADTGAEAGRIDYGSVVLK